MNNILKNIYGDRIVIQNWRDACKIKFNVKNREQNADIAIYLNNSLAIAIIWNLRHRKNCKGSPYLTLKEKWEEIKLPEDGLYYKYKEFNTNNSNSQYEKVLVISFKVLEDIKFDLYDYLKFDVEDEMPEKLKEQKGNLLYEWHDEKARARKSTSTWKRNQKFRKIVLENYNYSCAICGCDIEKILEAAHIIAVSDGGLDDVDNGICLCRNHHKMYDEKLFEINFVSHSICNIDDSVKDYLNEDYMIAISNKEKAQEEPNNGNIKM